MIEIRGWDDIVGIVLNIVFLPMWIYFAVLMVTAAFYIAKGALWCVGYRVLIIERSKDG